MLDLPIAGHVRFNPVDAPCVLPEAVACLLERNGRNVENTDATHDLAENEIHEAGIPGPNVDDSCGWVHTKW